MLELSIIMKNTEVEAGQAVYSKKVLSIYDIWVLGFSNHLLWQCPTRHISQAFINNVSSNHLDVGVGSGYYLKKHLPKSTKRIALLDLNENSLQSAANGILSFHPEIYKRNVLEPLLLDSKGFDSISINYLLHCLPGDMTAKGILFSHLFDVLNQEGILFGSTILGKGPQQNYFAKKLMAIYNNKGIFSNQADDAIALEAGLKRYFQDVQIQVIGSVALFSCRKR